MTDTLKIDVELFQLNCETHTNTYVYKYTLHIPSISIEVNWKRFQSCTRDQSKIKFVIDLHVYIHY